jgi:aryl-alcohol dehydrogenase-like predicted oxidoreductase
VQVATKFYPVDPRYNFPRSAKDLLPALDASLARLRVESVDLYQIHNPGFLSGKAIGEALAEAVKSGRCKAVGVSNYALDEMMPIYRALEKEGIPLASNQVEFSLLRQLPRTGGLLSACKDLGVGILAYSPLGMGRLTGKYSKTLPLFLSRSLALTHSRDGEVTGKYSKGNKAPSGRFFGRVDDEKLAMLVSKMRDIGARHGGKTPAQVCVPKEPCKGAIHYAKETY